MRRMFNSRLGLPGLIFSPFLRFSLAFISLILLGCASVYTEKFPEEPERSVRPKNLFIFLDGTANDPDSGTNIWRLYEGINGMGKDGTLGYYIEGVGNRDRPLSGMTLGRGMEKRLLLAYEFLAKNYEEGDRIFIFGFSRGAHQARALAGFLAYSGLPRIQEQKDDLRSLTNDIIEITKEKNDNDFESFWRDWQPGENSPLVAEIEQKTGIEMASVEVDFLGIWDTVPASFFKEFGDCKELADRRDGDRYKSGSYPPIRNIFHAVAIDEKRSKYRPLLICEAQNPRYTMVEEVWFPGAHADVGGGYEDDNGLPGISLNWMVGKLSDIFDFGSSLPEFHENPAGLAHWSIGDPPANLGSKCEDRNIPENAVVHDSFDKRKKAGKVPIRVHEEIKNLKYPVFCNDPFP